MSQKNPENLERIREAVKPLKDTIRTKGQTQADLAAYFGVSREIVNRWLNGQTPPPPERKQEFIQLLQGPLSLDHQQLLDIWQKVMVEVWNWDPLPLELSLNVPSRQQHLNLIGRDTLLTHLKQRLSSQGSFALTGMPGIGKTALAMELMHDVEVLQQFADGVFWVRLGEKPNVMDELGRLAERLNVVDVAKLTTEVDRYLAVKNKIDEGRRRFLVVIDDVWTIEPVRLFNFVGPNCCLVLTTRNEKVARGFFADPSKVVVVPELEYEQEESPAFELLNKLAPETCAADTRAAHELVKTVGGLPLSLVLLGGYLGDADRIHVSNEEKQNFLRIMKDDSQARLHLAQVRLGALSNKEMTLQAILELSLEDLQQNKAEKAAQAFSALGAFASKPERFDRSAAEYVTGDKGSFSLGILTARYLLEKYEQEQLAMHQVLTEVARMRTPAEAVERHQAFYLAIVNEDVENWQRIEQVYGQIKWAWEALPENEQLVKFVVALSTYHHRRGLWQDAMGWLNRGLLWSQAEHRQQDNSLFLMNQGHIYKNQGQWDEAKTRYEQSLAIAQELGDFDKVATILVSLGNILESQGQWDEAKKLYEQSLIIYRVLNDRHGEATTLSNLGDICEHQGRWDEAQELYQQSLAIYRELGDRHGEGGVLNNLAIIYKNQGQWNKAQELYQQSLAIAQELGDHYGEATVLSNLGDNYKNQGWWDEAQELYQQSLAIYQEVDDRHGEATILSNLGDICEHQGRWDEARQLYEQQLIIFRKLGDRRGEGIIFKNLGNIYKNQGQWDEAKTRYEQSLAILQELGDRQGVATILMNLGNVYGRQGRWDEVKKRYEQSLAIAQELGDRPSEASLLDSLGIVYESQGQWDEARQMREQSLTISRELKNRYSEGMALTNLGIVYESQGQWDEAKKLYEQSLAILQELGDRQDVATILMNLGNVYGRQGRWDEVKKRYEQSLILYQELGDRHGEGMILVNWGIILERQGHQQRAIALWLEAITKLHPDSPEFKQVRRWLRAYYMAAKIRRFFKRVFILAILGVIVWGILAAFGIVSWPLDWLW